MSTRYGKYTILYNSNKYYAPIRRGKKAIEHYETPSLYNPSVMDRTTLKTTPYIWKYGSRFYNLADQFYGDAKYWWVIAWYNGVPTEAHLKTGAVIYIPLNIEDAYRVLGV
jgi:nucleoid-associated protein YgaU|tara:strand:- start:538 stop:870 length:333 start_codon:yes stop_codon:yes gene_type:complete